MNSASTPSSRLQRTACDRCRRHKLKCNRDPGNEPCRRCLRVGESCVTAATRKPGRPSIRRIPSHPTGIAISEPSNALHTPPETSSSTPNSGSASSSPPPQPSQPSQLPTLPIHGRIITEKRSIRSGYDRVAQMERRSKCMRQLGELHVNLHVDVDVLRCASTADRCRHHGLEVDDCPPSFFISRLFNHGETLLKISEQFELTTSASTNDNDRLDNRLSCDLPTTISMISCYIMTIRLFRMILSVILLSIPTFLDPARLPDLKFRDLFQGLAVGSYNLEGRIDLQILFVVQTAEDIISRLEARFGVGCSMPECENGEESNSNHHHRHHHHHQPRPSTRATEVLSLLLEKEAIEQPQMDEPRDPCGTVHQIMTDIRRQLLQVR